MSPAMRAIAILLLLLAASTAQAQTEAPFGLVWGKSSDQVRAMGVELKDFATSDFGKSFIATGLPKALSDQETTLLSFGHDDKLWRIVAVGRNNQNDPAGNAVKNRYEELRGILEEKYGHGRTTHRLGDSIYAKPENFVYGISSGNSFWYSDFSTTTIDAQLGITAPDLSSARWRIIFEDKELRRQFQTSKKSNEKKAL